MDNGLYGKSAQCGESKQLAQSKKSGLSKKSGRDVVTDGGGRSGFPGVAVSLLKGGVGKSVTSLNVAHRLASRGNDVVLVDLDQDGHMTSQLGYADEFDRELDLGHALIDGNDPTDLLLDTAFGVELLPSNDNLENVQTQLKDERFADVKFRQEVAKPLVEDHGYDYIIVDVAGGRGKLSDNALIAMQKLIVPLAPEAGNINGLKKMMKRQIIPIREQIGLDIVAITPNKIRSSMLQHNAHRELVESLNRSDQFNDHLPEYAKVEEMTWDALDDGSHSTDIPKPGIRKRAAINKAFRKGLPVAEFDEDCDQIAAFDELADRVEEASNA